MSQIRKDSSQIHNVEQKKADTKEYIPPAWFQLYEDPKHL